MIVNYDPDTAGQVATERSIALLLEKEFDVRVLALPGAADPDKNRIKEQGVEAYRKLLAQAPPYLDYLIGKARHMDRTTAAGKVAALNFLMPYVQRLPDRLLRSEWATRIASELRVDEPVLREALRRAAVERRSEVKPKAELMGSPIEKSRNAGCCRCSSKPKNSASNCAERWRAKLCIGVSKPSGYSNSHFQCLRAPGRAYSCRQPGGPGRGLFFELLFEEPQEATWQEAESCLEVLRSRAVEQELAELQKKSKHKRRLKT